MQPKTHREQNKSAVCLQHMWIYASRLNTKWLLTKSPTHIDGFTVAVISRPANRSENDLASCRKLLGGGGGPQLRPQVAVVSSVNYRSFAASLSHHHLHFYLMVIRSRSLFDDFL